jgi:hypothetical protein
MPVTKITLSTAMRARDVSRPTQQQLTEAAAREEAAGRHLPPGGRDLPPGGRAAPAARPAPAEPREPQQQAAPGMSEGPAPPRRRRRRGR